METWQLIVSICAGLVTIITLADKLYKASRPVAKATDDLRDVPIVKAAINDLQTRVAKLEDHESNDLRAIDDHARAVRVLCRTMLDILDHMERVHDVKLDESRAAIRTYLLER